MINGASNKVISGSLFLKFHYTSNSGHFEASKAIMKQTAIKISFERTRHEKRHLYSYA